MISLSACWARVETTAVGGVEGAMEEAVDSGLPGCGSCNMACGTVFMY